MASGGSASSGRSPALLVLLLLAACRVGFLARHLHYPDLLLDFPFLGGDGLDWISNGLASAGYPVKTTGRSPLLPAVLGGLERLGALSWFPVLHQLVLPAGVVVLYLALRRWHPPRVALLAALLPLGSAVAAAAALEVMADTLAAVLLFLATLAFLAADRDPRRYLLAGLLAGTSALCQNAALLLALPAVVTLVACRRSHLRSILFWAGAALFLVLAMVPSILAAGAAISRGPSGVMARQWTLIDPSIRSLRFYAGAAAGLWGWPALALVAAGVVILLRARKERGWLVTSLFLCLGGFFVLLYRFEAQRFLLYLLLPSCLPLAAALAAFERRWLQTIAGLTAVVWSAWPIHGAPVAESRFTLAPVPALYADTARSPHFVRTTFAEAFADSPWQRVRAGHSRRPPGPVLSPALFADTGTTVLLHRPHDRDLRARQFLLGGALRRRVKTAPLDLYPPGWWGWAGAAPAGTAGGFAFLRLRLPGRNVDALVAVNAGDPVRERLAATPPGPAPTRRSLHRAWRAAEALDRVIGPGDEFATVIVNEPPCPWQHLTPFALRTSSIFMLTHPDRDEARRQLRRQPGTVRWRGRGIEVRQARLWGWGTLVASASGPCSERISPRPRFARPSG